MVRRPLCSLVYAVLLASLACGCVVSEQPLSSQADAQPDLRLVGTWRGQKEENSSSVSILRVTMRDRGTGHIEDITPSDGHYTKIEPSDFFVTRTGKASFLNVLPDADPSSKGAEAKPAGCLVYRYQVSDDKKSVQIWPLKAKTFVAAVASGDLKGKSSKALDDVQEGLKKSPPSDPTLTIEKHDPKNDPSDENVTLQDSPEHILGFIASKPDEEIFGPPQTYTKID